MSLSPKSSILNPTKGFTLIELIIAAAIASLFFIIISRTLATMISSRNRVNSNQNVQKLVDQTLLTMTQQSRWAATISSTATSLSFTTDTQNISYSLSGTNLVRTTSQTQGAALPTTENLNPPNFSVTQFSVTNRSADTNRPSYEILLTISHKPNQPGAPTLTYSNHTALTLRNKFPGAT